MLLECRMVGIFYLPWTSRTRVKLKLIYAALFWIFCYHHTMSASGAQATRCFLLSTPLLKLSTRDLDEDLDTALTAGADLRLPYEACG
ncbi:hypothetical protein F5884DRAFT_500275 [Xylogone sp. PMI_703]|nr:hypothetical protein F5884DRAFT_500275 [Xylogone sp. PMI_703]